MLFGAEIMRRKHLILICTALIVLDFCLAARPFIQALSTNQQAAKDKKERATTQSQDKKISPQNDPQKQKETIPTTNEKKDLPANTENPEEKRKQLLLQTKQLIESALAQTLELQNPVVKIKIRSVAADALWDSQEEKAREILTKDFRSIDSLSDPQQERGKPLTYKTRKLEVVKEMLKKELMTVISSHDPALTQSLLFAEKSDKDQTDKDRQLIQTGEMLGTAMDLSATSPEMASRIIRDSLKTGINPRFALSLISLRQSDPEAASAIFNEVFSRVSVSGDLWEFQKLTPYVLPTEIDRLYGGNYLTDPRRAKDAKTFIEAASSLLAQRLESPQTTANLSPEMVRRESTLWRSLLPSFNDLAPEKAWMINMRLNQLSTQGTGLSGKPAGGSHEPPAPEDRLKKLLADAESATGARRDNLLELAAYAALRLEDFDQAISLIERVENQEIRETEGSFILNTASIKALSKEGPDKALALARRIQWPGTRVAAFNRIRAALRTLKKQDQASELLDELRAWLDSRDNNSDKVWGWLIYLDHFAKEDSEKAFAALSSFVGALNKADLEPPAKPLANRNYWYPEFHDFRKSLGPLARADFERALQEVQLVKDREALLLIQVALCNEYLKADKQKPALKISR
jgi:hypothetical protein